MKTEQEVRDAITGGLKHNYVRMIEGKEFTFEGCSMTKEEVQDLAVIIGKALGVIEEAKNECN